jgi:hypothetical protein
MSQFPTFDPKHRRRQRLIRRLVLWLLLVGLSFYVFLSAREHVDHAARPSAVQNDD